MSWFIFVDNRYVEFRKKKFAHAHTSKYFMEQLKQLVLTVFRFFHRSRWMIICTIGLYVPLAIAVTAALVTLTMKSANVWHMQLQKGTFKLWMYLVGMQTNCDQLQKTLNYHKFSGTCPLSSGNYKKMISITLCPSCWYKRPANGL